MAQRLLEFETYQVRSQERLDMLTVLGAEKSSRYVERGSERKILTASTVCCSS